MSNILLVDSCSSDVTESRDLRGKCQKDHVLVNDLCMTKLARGSSRSSLTQGLTSLTAKLSHRGEGHSPFIISFFEGRKHVIIWQE